MIGKMLRRKCSLNDTAKKDESKPKAFWGGEETGGPKKNISQMGEISTSSVMAELRKDEAFLADFREYVKYEQRIVDFAWTMHNAQYDLVRKQR